VQFEVLYIEGCPNWQTAADLLRESLDTTGHADAPISFRLLRTSDDAAETVFAGSPTITLDGRDLLPSSGPIRELACRMYRSSSGSSGLPTVGQLIEGIRAHER
jgi:hypothetical protein